MSEYKEGDLIEAVNGETVVRWRAGEDNPLQMAAWEIELLYEVTVLESAPTPLPTAPGTVIAIGEWHLVRLRPYTPNVPAAWEFLPVPERVQQSLRRSGQKDQCVYSDEWVRAEADQEGGFTIISEPVPETATKVIDRVRELLDPGSMGTGSYAHLTSVLHIVELENGVRS